MSNQEAIEALKRIRDEAMNEFIGDWADYEAFSVAIKALKVVTCRECKYWRNKDPQQIPTASIMCGHMHPDDFCSYGERKEE